MPPTNSDSASSTAPDYAYKIVLLGDSNVGKTNFLLRYQRDEFDHNTKPTIGVELYSKRIVLTDPSGSSSPSIIKASIWDTAGQERYRAITPTYYRNSAGIFLVYDVTNQESFDNILTWLAEVRKCTEEGSVVFMLVGNKIDLGYSRVVSTEDGAALAKQHGMFFIETSSKDNTNVEKAFDTMIREIHRRNVSGNASMMLGGGAGAGSNNLPQNSQKLSIGGGTGGAGGKSKCC